MPPNRKSQEWNWQGDRSHTTATYSPFEQPITMSYGPQPVYFYPYSSWGWFDQEAHVPSYFRPQYVNYVAPTNSKKSSYCKDHFDRNQLDSIGLDGKKVLNRLALVDSLKAQGSNAQERDVEPSSGDKVVVHELQIEDILEDNKIVTILEDTVGAGEISPTKAKAD